MDDKKPQNIKISTRLKKVLDQLESETEKMQCTTQQDKKIPAHGREDRRNDKDFPRVLGHA